MTVEEEQIAYEKRVHFLSQTDGYKRNRCVFCGEEFLPPICGHINCGGKLLDTRLGIYGSPISI